MRIQIIHIPLNRLYGALTATSSGILHNRAAVDALYARGTSSATST